jgi:hypothetical protein
LAQKTEGGAAALWGGIEMSDCDGLKHAGAKFFISPEEFFVCDEIFSKAQNVRRFLVANLGDGAFFHLESTQILEW